MFFPNLVLIFELRANSRIKIKVNKSFTRQVHIYNVD